MQTSYAVARCAPSGTLAVAKELYNDFDIAAWTPRLRKTMRLPRGRPRRIIIKPLLPSFIFIQLDDYDRTLFLAERRRISYVIRPMIVNGRVAIVEQMELCRISEPIDEPRTSPDIRIEIGDRVTISGGPFEGMSGQVRACGPEYVTIHSEKISAVLKVPAFMLQKAAL